MFATCTDLLSLPDDARAEVLAGEIVTSPAPLPRHSKVQRAMSRFVTPPIIHRVTNIGALEPDRAV
jgi:hypothetical protein